VQRQQVQRRQVTGHRPMGSQNTQGTQQVHLLYEPACRTNTTQLALQKQLKLHQD
jgi:hypothetical protein